MTEAAASASSSIESRLLRRSGSSISGCPKAIRSRAWTSASSSPRRMSPAARIAFDSREPLTISIICLKPDPRSPTTHAAAPA